MHFLQEGTVERPYLICAKTHNLEKAYYSQHIFFVHAGNCDLYYNICSWIQQQQQHLLHLYLPCTYIR